MTTKSLSAAEKSRSALGSDSAAASHEHEYLREKFRALLALGKERGYLTQAEIIDHLPENMSGTEALEGLISSLTELGIPVYEQTADAETLLWSDNAAAVPGDEEAEAAVDAALSAGSAEAIRTTDPLRLYMNRMGSAKLLTRKREIEIAQRIEAGLQDMIQIISTCPAAIYEMLMIARKIGNGEMKINDFVEGLPEHKVKRPPPRHL
ncbi:MAG TPA: RNA polymerase sigma factor region1.1 domain-containing protein [Noviherbaspirillum sp.]